MTEESETIGITTQSKERSLRYRLDEWQVAALLLLPALGLIGLLFLYPLGYNIWLSLTDQQLIQQGEGFIGLANYAELLGSNQFYQALLNNIVYAVGTTATSIVFGVVISLLLNREFKGRGIATTLVIFPYLIPTVVVALAFQWILHDLFGIVNSFLLWAGVIESTIAWFSEFAMQSVIAVSVWKFTPFIVILCLARLQTIPGNLYEAAKIEGAGRWQQFRYITLPQLRMVLFIAILLRFVWIFNMFDIIWLLTGGGPVNRTEHLPILIYKTMFSSYEVGYASAIAMVVLVMLVGFLVTYFRVYAPTENGGESA